MDNNNLTNLIIDFKATLKSKVWLKKKTRKTIYDLIDMIDDSLDNSLEEDLV